MGFGRSSGDETPPRGSTEYQLSIGKIRDTLQSDYPNFFRRSPDFGIYDDRITLQFGEPFRMRKDIINGKPAYRRAFGVLQLLARKAVGPDEGAVDFRIDDGAAHGCALRVRWEVYGDFRLWRGSPRPFHISAVSLYSVARQEIRPRLLRATLLGGACDEGSSLLAYRIHRHSIVFMEIRPPQLRSMLLGQSLSPDQLGLALHSAASSGPSLTRGGGHAFPAAAVQS